MNPISLVIRVMNATLCINLRKLPRFKASTIATSRQKLPILPNYWYSTKAYCPRDRHPSSPWSFSYGNHIRNALCSNWLVQELFRGSRCYSKLVGDLKWPWSCNLPWCTLKPASIVSQVCRILRLTSGVSSSMIILGREPIRLDCLGDVVDRELKLIFFPSARLARSGSKGEFCSSPGRNPKSWKNLSLEFGGKEPNHTRIASLLSLCTRGTRGSSCSSLTLSSSLSIKFMYLAALFWALQLISVADACRQ